MFPRHSRPAGPFARFAHLLSAAATAGRKPRRRRSLAAHRALRLESLESRAMLSSVPFIASLPQDLAGKTAGLFTVHGRYGNNALNGDWELGLTSNTSAPPQHQVDRTWNSGASEPFTFSFTNTRPDTFTNSLNATFSIGGSGVQFDYGSQFASYEPNAIKIWASTATATSSLTINDLRITTPGVTGKTVFPGASIAVSQASGTVFQEASSAESVGEFRLWQSPEDVKQRHSDALCGSEAERVSGGQFHFAVYYGEHPIVDVFYPAAAA